MVRRPWLNCILALGLAVSLTSCYQLPAPPDPSVSLPDTSAPEPAVTQPLTLAVYETQSLHPLFSDDRVNLTLCPLIYEGLFQLDTSFTAHPVLCHSYQVSEDGLVWTFTLRRGVTFSDGTPLTAAHVVRSLELAHTPQSRYNSRFPGISSVSAGSEYEICITLTHPNTGLPALLDIPIIHGEGEYPLGTGPYVLAREDGMFSLIPRSGSEPTIPLISVTRTRELTAAFERGDLTLVCTDPAATDSPGYSTSCTSVDYDTTNLVYLGFNTAKSPFGSPAARRAAAAALDRSALVSAAWSGHARVAALPIPPASPLYDESLARQLPTADDARELVSQAGLSGRGLTLIVNSENSSRVTAARLIARQLEQAGLSVNVSPLPWDDYLATLSAGGFDLYLGEASLTADLNLTPLISADGSLNYSRWRSTAASRLLDAFLSAPEEHRPQAASELCSLLTEQMPLAPICFKRGSVLSRWEPASQLTPTRANAFYGLYE